MTPFQAVYSSKPLTIVPYKINSNDPIMVFDLLQQRDKFLQQLKAYLARAQERMKHFVDKKGYEVYYNVGE